MIENAESERISCIPVRKLFTLRIDQAGLSPETGPSKNYKFGKDSCGPRNRPTSGATKSSFDFPVLC